MTNPTLIGQDTSWRGFTWTQIKERLLASRGLTLDSSTNRVVAAGDEETAAEAHLQIAIDLLSAEFPSLWVIRTYSTTWTSGDHSIMCPGNTMAVLAVTFDGLSLHDMSREDYYQLLRSDDEGGGIADAGRPGYFKVTGYTDQAANPVTDPRIVIRLHPTPSSDYAGKTVTIEYIALSVDVSTAGDVLPLYPFLQKWVLERAKESWAAENGDSAIQGVAEAERMKVEASIGRWIEGTRPPASRMRWRYPKPNHGTRYRS